MSIAIPHPFPFRNCTQDNSICRPHVLPFNRFQKRYQSFLLTQILQIRSADWHHMTSGQPRLHAVDCHADPEYQMCIVSDFLFHLRTRLCMSDANLDSACVTKTEENSGDVVILHCDSLTESAPDILDRMLFFYLRCARAPSPCHGRL